MTRKTQDPERHFESIAHVRTDFHEKFGVPRQSGLGSRLTGLVVFTPKYRGRDALRGIEEFSHLWLIWDFSLVPSPDRFEPLVRPPRLGGNEKRGVFATRSPFRPNPIGLSLVRLEQVLDTEDGPALLISGVDVTDGTPVYDIKPYLPHLEAVTDARGGFALAHAADRLDVRCPDDLLEKIPQAKREALLEALSLDPRPAYQDDPDRVYGFGFAGTDVRFSVSGDTLTVRDIVPLPRAGLSRDRPAE